ncbi:MAG TPA: tetratricopeptide repeat protein [Planctomycetota bacterium]|nr:tetratricopeptide repeat protein [Planctomycetota bacterium]
MDYPGDPALAQEVRTRVLTTFRQTVELAEEGRLQEASLGCDFILKMDPRFEPARELRERLAGSAAPVSAADLLDRSPEPARPTVPPPPPPATTAPAEDLRRTQFSPQDLALSLADEGVDLGALFETPSAPQAAAPPLGHTASEPASRIDELLAEGQRAFDESQYQNAIDVWSRIYLIDLDHAEANRRIDAARKLKAEQERVADEQLHEGVRALEEGRSEEARAILERLLEQNPNHIAAREYLGQLPGGEGGVLSTHEAPGEIYGEPPEVPLPTPPAVAASHEGATSLTETKAPRRGASGAKGQARAVSADRRFVWIGAVGLALLLAAGWFLASNWKRLFPNAEAAAPTVAVSSMVEEAVRLHAGGDIEGAVQRLRRVTHPNPEYPRAQELLAEWTAPEADPAADAAAAAAADEHSAQRIAARSAFLERARRAYEEREYLGAVKSFRAAEQIAPLDGALADLYADSKRQLLPLAAQVDLFQQREWDRVLPLLWRQHLDDESNRDVRRLLSDTLFNMGVQAMRDGDKAAAVQNFRDLVRIAPEDALAQRLLLFAESYPGSSQDLVFQILASQLEFRT